MCFFLLKIPIVQPVSDLFLTALIHLLKEYVCGTQSRVAENQRMDGGLWSATLREKKSPCLRWKIVKDDKMNWVKDGLEDDWKWVRKTSFQKGIESEKFEKLETEKKLAILNI